MDRRKSLKLMAWSTFSASLLLDGCKPGGKEATAVEAAPEFTLDRMPEEVEAYEKASAGVFFTEHELATITVLSDIIIPADAVSGSASQAGVPGFIEFIVKDKPELQVPMRGGLRWLDLHSVKRHGKVFRESSGQEQIAVVNEIAYPQKAKPEVKQGVSFFNLMRNLTATGFYTSQMGIKDLGYAGNKPNQWNGVPNEVLRQYGLSYTEKELKECISFSAV